MIVHHVHLRPTLDGTRVIDVTMDLSGEQLLAGAHAVRSVVAGRYRVSALEAADDILAMRELTVLADELQALAVPGAISPITLTVGGVGRFNESLDEFARTAGERPEREGDAEALPHVYAIVDGVADAHADGLRAALDDTLIEH